MAIDLKNMDKKKLIFIAVAIAAGLIAVVLANNYIEESSQTKAIELMAPNNPLKQQAEALAKRIDALERNNQILATQQQALTQMKREQPAALRQETSLGVKTPPGKRAVTAMVDKIYAVGGLVAPGDYVDIIAHLSVPDDLNKPGETNVVSVTLFQNVLILAVAGSMQSGQNVEAQRATSLPITFALDPQEAGLITFAEEHGKLQLSLRSPVETDAYKLPSTSWEGLSDYIKKTQGIDLSIETKKDSSAPKKSQPIEIFRGAQ